MTDLEAFARFERYRQRLFAAIRAELARDPSCKMHEGATELCFPNVFGGEYRVSMYSYVLGLPCEWHYTGSTLAGAVAKAEQDLERIVQERGLEVGL